MFNSNITLSTKMLGVDYMLFATYEEFAELEQAITKFLRNGWKDEKYINNFNEELCDVLLMIEWFLVAFLKTGIPDKNVRFFNEKSSSDTILKYLLTNILDCKRYLLPIVLENKPLETKEVGLKLKTLYSNLLYLIEYSDDSSEFYNVITVDNVNKWCSYKNERNSKFE